MHSPLNSYFYIHYILDFINKIIIIKVRRTKQLVGSRDGSPSSVKNSSIQNKVFLLGSEYITIQKLVFFVS